MIKQSVQSHRDKTMSHEFHNAYVMGQIERGMMSESERVWKRKQQM